MYFLRLHAHQELLPLVVTVTVVPQLPLLLAPHFLQEHFAGRCALSTHLHSLELFALRHRFLGCFDEDALLVEVVLGMGRP